MSDVQHTQMVLGAAMAIAALGTFVLSLAGRWLGGSWTTLLAILAAMLLCYQPLIGASLLAGFKTDLLRRILLGAIPFTLAAMALSFKKVPPYLRFTFGLLAPDMFLWWVFAHFDLATPRQTLFVSKIAPVGLAILAGWALIEPIALRSSGAAAPIVVGPVTAGLAFLLFLSAENQAGLMAPIIPATALGALFAAIIAFFLRRPISLARGPVLLWLTLGGALFAFMWLDTEELPLRYLYWIAAAPPLAWMVEIGPVRKSKPWQRESIRLALVAAPVIVACTLAFQQHRKDAAAAGDEYGMLSPQVDCSTSSFMAASGSRGF